MLCVSVSVCGCACVSLCSSCMYFMQEYWEMYDKHPHLQGGFIWDWVDQGLINTAKAPSGCFLLPCQPPSSASLCVCVCVSNFVYRWLFLSVCASICVALLYSCSMGHLPCFSSVSRTPANMHTNKVVGPAGCVSPAHSETRFSFRVKLTGPLCARCAVLVLSNAHV